MRETAWLHFDGSLWQGEFFGVSVPGHNHGQSVPMERAISLLMGRPAGGQLWPLCYADGLEEFDGLAAATVANFDLPPFQRSEYAHLSTATVRWLGTLLGMDFVERSEVEGYRVIQLCRDVFTASARAIEVLGAKVPPPVKTEEGEGGGGDPMPADAALGERARLVLKVLLDSNAFHSDRRMTTEDIAVKAAGKGTDPNPYKAVISELKAPGYVDTKEGRRGGCWLTASGKERAKKL